MWATAREPGRVRTMGDRSILDHLLRAIRRPEFPGLQRRSVDRHFRDIIDRSSDGIVIADLGDRAIIYANDALLERLGCTQSDLRRLRLEDVFCGAESWTEDFLERLSEAHEQTPVHMQQPGKSGDLLDIDVRLHRLTIDGRRAYAFITRDLSIRKKVEKQLIENQKRLDWMAHHDQLTGLPNRHHLHAVLPEIIDASMADGTMLGLVFMDLDHFKDVNDTRGHDVGDRLLQEVARRLRACVRESDIVIRMGGDEFVIVLRKVKSHDEITHGSARLVATLNQAIVLDGNALQVTASFGVSTFPRDGADMNELLKHSDTAMYQAKDRGRNNVQIFTNVMNRKLEHRVAMEASLRDALRLKQLDVHYQPVVDLRSRRIVGLEALVRWKHPKEGMIPPDRFIPVAEETGLIVPIGNFVLHRNLLNMSAWQKSGVTHVHVSFYVSPTQLQGGSLQNMISTLLATYGFAPALLQMEMTERTVFDLSVPQAETERRDTIAQIRDLGVRIAIDDFGTGYSSLSYLKHWQVDSLKIDKSFVRDLASDSSDLAIVSAIIAIAKHMRIQVVAEGIEGYQQADVLSNLGCHFGQGFLFAKPMAADACLPLLGRLSSSAPDAEPDDMMPIMRIAAK